MAIPALTLGLGWTLVEATPVALLAVGVAASVGTKSAQSLVLVDGQRMANATSADSNLQYLNIDQIERVEVLRGSRSVIYGSDAIGGVIQVFTRRGADQDRKSVV